MRTYSSKYSLITNNTIMKFHICLTASILMALNSFSCADADMAQDNIFYKDGKMQQTKDGKVFLMEREVDTKNGYKIMRDGKVVGPDGAVTQMRNGQVVSMDGKIMDHEPAKPKKDGFRMHYGQIYATVGGSENLLKENTTLANGTKVKTSGEIVKKDGAEMKLSEGQKIDMDGIITKYDGRDSDHARVQDGKVTWSEDGEESVLQKSKTLGNGTKIMPDGTIHMRDGTERKLKEGDLITSDGEVIEAK